MMDYQASWLAVVIPSSWNELCHCLCTKYSMSVNVCLQSECSV